MSRFNFLKIFSLVALVGILVMGISVEKVSAVAGVSARLSYQGRLTDNNGSPLSNTYCIRYSIYDAQSGGTKLWPAGTPTATSTIVSNGVFNAPIGEMDSLAGYDFSASTPEYLNVEVNTTPVSCGGTWENLSPRQSIDATAYARVAYSVYGGDVQVGDAGGTSGKLLKLAWKNTSDTLGGACSGPQGSLWFNSFSNFTRICNNNIIKSLSGLTNDFFDVSGPTTARTFAFPDANATVLTSNTAVTAAQGGTGQTTYTIGDLLYASGASALSKLIDVTAGSYLRSGGAGVAPVWSTVTLPNTAATGDLLYASATNVLSALTKGTANQFLRMDGTGTNVLWSTFTGSSNALLDGSTHTDTTAGTVARGDIITGQTTTPKWTRLAKGTANQVLSMDGTGTDVVWATVSAGGAPTTATYITQTADATLSAEQALSALATGYMKVTTGTGVVTSQATPIPVADGGTGASTLTANNVILGNGTTAPTFVAPGTSGNLLQSNGTTWTSAAPPAASGLPKYNQSVTTPAAGFAADTYLVGSSITLATPATTLKAGARYHLIFDVSKTAAGTATPIINIRYGTLGTTGDASKCALTWTAQTAATDTGIFEIWATFRTIGSGTTAVLQCAGQRTHGASVTGLGTLVGETKVATSAGFDSTVANSILGASVNGGTSAVWTITLVQAMLENIN
ncbi:MAG: hypothetical protein HY228_00935 [Candidatus Yonathbacteria bacterium]|nr:hypothetical protein [Candidatus Yonathbacteria bacterium]